MSLFDAPRIFPLNYCGDFAETADFTGDGILDVVTASTRLSVMVGAGDGTFTEVLETTGVLIPLCMAIGDLNGDGLLDVVLGDDYGASEGRIRVLLGNGDGTFYSNQIYVTVPNPVEMGIDDLDGDGDLDLVIIDDDGSDGVVHLNDGNGAFGPAIAFQVGDIPMGLVLGHFNSDGLPDLAVIHRSDDGIWIYSGNGDGTFTAGQVFPMTTTGLEIAAGDLNGDGQQDLVASSFSTGPEPGLHILLGDGAGGFTLVQQYGIHGSFISLVRMNEDQHLDIVIDHGDVIAVMIGNGDGTFEEEIDSGVVILGLERFTVGDVDRDDDQDLIMPLNSQEAGISLILNRGDGSLQTAPPLDVDEVISWTDTVDLDLDGDLDVVVSHGRNSSDIPEVETLLNAGNGTFTLIESWSEGGINDVNHFSVGNLNTDNIPDLAVSFANPDPYEKCAATLIGQGDGTFRSHIEFTHDEDIFQSHLWLVDGDAYLDLAAVCEDGIWICFNEGDGNFQFPCYHAVAGNNSTLAGGADLDGNGTLDLVVFNRDGNNFSVSFSNSSGLFSTPVEYVTENNWLSLNLGDLNGDGDPDLVYSQDSNPLDTLCVRLNDGNGVFSDETVWSQGLNVGKCRLADINSDGLLDAVSANGWSVTVHPGLGDGGFGDELRFSTFGSQISLPAPGDFDGDGDLDLVVGRTSSDLPQWGLYFRNTTSLCNLFAAGPGRGEDNPAQVRTFTWTGSVQQMAQWQAYGVNRYGVNVALGELDGSAGLEVLTGAGPGAVFGPHVRGFENTGVPLPGVSFLAYGTNKWGVNVAAGDLDADGFDEIVTGAGPGAVFSPHVRGWNWDGSGVPTQIPGISYFAYGTPKWGVNVCCGDIDGDGFDEIVTGAGPGAVYGPHVRGWNCDGSGAAAISGVSFLAYGTNKYGVNVCCGDIDGDGIDEMVTGAGPGSVFGPHVRGWNWDGSGSTQPIPGVSFFAHEYTQWGANVACGDLDGDGIDEILTGPGPGTAHEPRIRGWNYDGAVLTAVPDLDFYGFDPGAVTHGVKPAGLRASRR